MAEMRNCVGSLIHKSSKEIDRVYKVALEIIKEDSGDWMSFPEEKNKTIKKSKKDFKAYSDSRCAFIATQKTTGTAAADDLLGCLLEMNLERINDITETIIKK